MKVISLKNKYKELKKRKRGNEEDEDEENEGKEMRREEKAKVIIEIWKMDKVIDELEIGPMNYDEICVFGRDPRSDVTVDHKSISRNHLHIGFQDKHLFLMDLGSGIKN